METPRERPKELLGHTYRILTGCGKMYITVNHDEIGLFEIFARVGKNGGCSSAQLELACRSITAGLRAGVDPKVFIKQAKGIRCPSSVWEDGQQILSCGDAIGRAIESENGKLLSEKLESSRRKAE